MARPKKATTQFYKFTLQIGDKTYTSEGTSILDALMNLEKPTKIMNKAILRLEHDGKFTQQLFFPQRLKRLFYSPTFQVVHAKMLEQVGLKPVH